MTSITCCKKAHENSFGKRLCIFSPMKTNHLWHLNRCNVEDIEGFELCVPPCRSACALKGENASVARRACQLWAVCVPCGHVALQVSKRCFPFRKLGRAQLSEELPL